jgi:hypothetical protein
MREKLKITHSVFYFQSMPTVNELIRESDPRLRASIRQVRAIVKKSMPQAKEYVKWGIPHYYVGKVKVACIMIYRDHINLGFFRGAELNSKLLEGTGKGLRHIKIRTRDDIKETEYSRLLKQAANIEVRNSS